MKQSPQVLQKPKKTNPTSQKIACEFSKINNNQIMIQRFLLAVSLCLLSAGCATDVANRYYASTKYPPKNPQEVQILKQAPARPYEVIADFQSRGESPKSVAKKAAKIGADAVIVVMLGGYYELGTEWANVDFQADTYTRINGTAIRYK